MTFRPSARAAIRPEAARTSSVGCSHQRPLEANKGGAAAGLVEADVERLESRTNVAKLGERPLIAA